MRLSESSENSFKGCCLYLQFYIFAQSAIFHVSYVFFLSEL